MEQRLRDILGFQIGDGTAQIRRTIVARARAGRDAVSAELGRDFGYGSKAGVGGTH